MKITLTLFTLFIVTNLPILSIVQNSNPNNYVINFDDSISLQYLAIDTISNPHNTWQVGKPHKSEFKNAYSAPNAIITDTTSPYPPNDTSVFVVKTIACIDGGLFQGLFTSILSGYYYSNTDSIKDYGEIEFSPDKGQNWINLLTDSVLIDPLNQEYWYSDYNPTLTGNSGGWKYFGIDVARLCHFYGVMDGDTLLYRMTFISDSIQTYKDGLMFDNLNFFGLYLRTDEQNDLPVESYCYPSPVQDKLTIRFENTSRSKFELKLFDISGRVFKKQSTKSNQIVLAVQGLQSGLYFYKLVDRKNRKMSTGKFVKK